MRQSGVLDDTRGKGEIASVTNRAVDDDVGIAASRPGLGTLFLCSDI
jgi:hypothetical protein